MSDKAFGEWLDRIGEDTPSNEAYDLASLAFNAGHIDGRKHQAEVDGTNEIWRLNEIIDNSKVLYDSEITLIKGQRASAISRAEKAEAEAKRYREALERIAIGDTDCAFAELGPVCAEVASQALSEDDETGDQLLESDGDDIPRSQCCGAEMHDWPDSDLCPDCHEHTGRTRRNKQ